jgi:hypothetical protein
MKTLFLILFLFIPCAFANLPDPTVKDGRVYPANPLDPATAASLAIQGTADAQRAARGVAEDGIAGTCEFSHATCTGAVVTLYDAKNVMVDQQVINLEGNFGFQNLKKNNFYRVVVDYTRHGAEGERDKIQPGRVIHIQLEEKTSL